MHLRGLLWLNAVFPILPVALLASAAVEGRVELPKSHSAPVQAKRYQIVTKGGVLSTQPPLRWFISRVLFPTSFTADETSHAKGFDVHSFASPGARRNQS